MSLGWTLLRIAIYACEMINYKMKNYKLVNLLNLLYLEGICLTLCALHNSLHQMIHTVTYTYAPMKYIYILTYARLHLKPLVVSLIKIEILCHQACHQDDSRRSWIAAMRALFVCAGLHWSLTSDWTGKRTYVAMVEAKAEPLLYPWKIFLCCIFL